MSRRKTLVALSLSVLLATCVTCPSIAQSSNKGLELSRLLQMYMRPKNLTYDVLLPWTTGSDPGTQIAWQHAGIEECSNYEAQQLGMPFCRSGQVVVTVNGKPTHTVLGKVVEPGKWQIVLAGGHAGVIYLIVDSSVNSQELDPEILKTAVRSSHNGMQLTHVSSCEGSEQFKITMPGRENAFVSELWSCGSGGCHIVITLANHLKDGEPLANCSP